jgi:isoprenylcysteine carboxyl methyltransferase (ICMT) family protein YpbQ
LLATTRGFPHAPSVGDSSVLPMLIPLPIALIASLGDSWALKLIVMQNSVKIVMVEIFFMWNLHDYLLKIILKSVDVLLVL